MAAVRGRKSQKRSDHPISGLGNGTRMGKRHTGAGHDLGQRLMAQEQNGAAVNSPT